MDIEVEGKRGRRSDVVVTVEALSGFPFKSIDLVYSAPRLSTQRDTLQHHHYIRMSPSSGLAHTGRHRGPLQVYLSNGCTAA
jgi:hypothetical protein